MCFFYLCFYAYHTPPEGISVTFKVRLSVRSDGVLLRQVDEVARKDEAEESNVQCCYQFLFRIGK